MIQHGCENTTVEQLWSQAPVWLDSFAPPLLMVWSGLLCPLLVFFLLHCAAVLQPAPFASCFSGEASWVFQLNRRHSHHLVEGEGRLLEPEKSWTEVLASVP